VVELDEAGPLVLVFQHRDRTDAVLLAVDRGPVEQILGRLDIAPERRPDVHERAGIALAVGRPLVDLDEGCRAPELEDEAAALAQPDVVEPVDQDPLHLLGRGFDRGHGAPLAREPGRAGTSRHAGEP
jgi:hypothetical protein